MVCNETNCLYIILQEEIPIAQNALLTDSSYQLNSHHDNMQVNPTDPTVLDSGCYASKLLECQNLLAAKDKVNLFVSLQR